MAKAGRLLIVLGIDPTKLEKDLRKFQNRMNRISRQMAAAGRGLTVGITAPLAAVGATAIRASVRFEDAFANVRKTVTTSEAGFAELERGIRDMSQELPVSAEELSRTAAALGQVGVQEEALLDVTKAMIQLAETSNLVATEGGVALARFANITGRAQTEIPKLANAVTVLGSNFATTEKEIVDMSTRLAGAATSAGLTEDEILALSTALTSVGIRAEAGGTAMSRVLQEMKVAVESGGEKLEALAEVAGMTAEEFQRGFREDAGGAVLEFIRGLGDLSGQGARVFEVLGDLDFGAIRVKTSLINSALASDVLGRALETAGDAIKTTADLEELAGQRFATTGSQLKIFTNQAAELARGLGDELTPILLHLVNAFRDNFLPVIRAIIEGFADLSEGWKNTILVILGVAAAIGPTLVVLGALAASIRSLTTAVILLSRTQLFVLLGALAALGTAFGVFAVDVANAARETDLLGKNVEKIADSAETASVRWKKFQAAVGQRKVLTNTVMALEAQKKALEDLEEPTVGQRHEIERLSKAIAELRQENTKLFFATANTDTATLELAAKMEVLAEKERAAAQAMGEIRHNQDGLAGATAHVSRALKVHRELLEAQTEAYGPNNQWTKETARNVETLAAGLEGLENQQKAATKATVSASTAFQQFGDKLAFDVGIVEALGGKELERAEQILQALEAGFRAAGEEARKAGLEVEEFLATDEAKNFVELIGLAKASVAEFRPTEELKDSWGQFFTSMGLNARTLSGEFQSFARSMSNNLGESFARSAVLGESFEDNFERLWQRLLLTVVTNLAAMAVEELALFALKQGLLGAELATFIGVKETETAVELKGIAIALGAWVAAHVKKLALLAVELATVISNLASEIFLNIVAGWSSIPFVGWAIGLAVAGAAIGGILAAAGSFAEGGIAVGPQLAVIGDNPGRREAIIPSEMFNQFGLEGGGGAPQLIQVLMDRRVVASAAVRGMPSVVNVRLGGGA